MPFFSDRKSMNAYNNLMNVALRLKTAQNMSWKMTPTGDFGPFEIHTHLYVLFILFIYLF